MSVVLASQIHNLDSLLHNHWQHLLCHKNLVMTTCVTYPFTLILLVPIVLTRLVKDE